MRLYLILLLAVILILVIVMLITPPECKHKDQIYYAPQETSCPAIRAMPAFVNA